jgi:hypothetical protein
MIIKKESVMKTGKIASFAIAALVLVGAIGIWAVADVSAKSSITSKAFIFFISAVIVVQVVPGIMLLGAMLKGVCSLASKKVAVTANSK